MTILRQLIVKVSVLGHFPLYSRSSVTQHADNSTLPITQHPKNIWLDSYLLHVNKNHITQQI